ncbi:MAG: glycosyltransferase family 4 protein [candidate division WOR-3 bacterium]
MRFLFPLLSFKKHGGVRALSLLMNGLAERGHEVYLVVPEDTYEEFYELNPEVKKIFTPPRRRNPISVLRTLLHLFTKAPPADFVVVSFFPTYFPALLHKSLKKSKLVYYIQDAEQLFYPFPFSLIASITYLLPANLILCASTWVKNKTVRRGKILNPPVDEAFLSMPSQCSKNLSHIALTFRWDKRKGPELARRILLNPKFTEFEFFVAGQDPEVEKPNVHYLGNLKTEELIKVYDHSTFFILTSKFEGFGLPPLEAMARGCIPISFTKTGPLDYIAHGKNGFFVETEDKLYEVFKALSQNPEKVSELSRNCITTAKQFTAERFLREFESSLNLS